ncbi:hypothetical protein PHYSODRAFT_286544 [Phytophthora sojae]|uniref:DDE Tnp4 domain-containing protein n=1 Tax=Phytophthora sojae (strain P6497) TaxID=1094619 RepID=G4ZT61_PHYSP|nr:hypothetical protein PHYSODRAFT_286544 [Phytophthora sojae]EGZ13093.1 hypothetical protein PHYSODRAFT_286544 [Phytophthora sojae]|eukprot:XP_009530522.1 hypothetical protein PHYSODRAFT_286544 [Phytophthora sojae]
MASVDTDAFLVVTDAFLKQGRELAEARREVYRLLLEEAWRTAMRSRNYLTAQCLEAPCNSAWMLLYRFGSDVNFINATSLTRPAFEQLLRRFSRFYFIPKAKLRGRPPKLRYHHQVLGLVLSFYVGSMEQSSLSMLFGLPPSTLSRILCRAEEALSKALHGYAPARISWPSPTRQAELASSSRHASPSSSTLLVSSMARTSKCSNLPTQIFKMLCTMDGYILFSLQELSILRPTAALSGADTTARVHGMTRTRRSALG